MTAAVKKKTPVPALKLVSPKVLPPKAPAKPAPVAKALAPKAPLAKIPGAAAKPVAPVRKHEFRTGDFIVYPTHGVGRIQKIYEQEVAGI